MLAALVAMRRRFPGIAARELPKMGVGAIWVYHPIVTPRLAEVARSAGVELIAWTVDDLDRMRKLVAAGVTGHLLERPAPVRLDQLRSRRWSQEPAPIGQRPPDQAARTRPPAIWLRPLVFFGSPCSEPIACAGK